MLNYLVSMKILKLLSFIVLFSVSLSFSNENFDPKSEDSTTVNTFSYETTVEDFNSKNKFDFDLISEDYTSESALDYLSSLDDFAPLSTFDYPFVFKNIPSESAFESSDIKNLNYPPYDRDCPLHEHWEFCTGLCQRNCSNWSKALICPDICVQGCLCDWGFTRGPEGNCIPVSECPPIEKEEPIKINVQYRCKRNEHFSICGDPKDCQKDCSNYDKEIPCDYSCEPGCVCNQGFVRGPTGKCVSVEQCRNPTQRTIFQPNKPFLCRKNAHFSACNGLPMCQKSCSNYNQPTICPLVCVPGCVCDNGYVIGSTGECVPLEQCSFESTSTQESKQSNLLNQWKEETTDEEYIVTSSTQSEATDPVTVSSSEDNCPNEISCTRKCKLGGHAYGICIGFREEHCACF